MYYVSMSCGIPPNPFLTLKAIKKLSPNPEMEKEGGGVSIHVRLGTKIIKTNDFSNLNLKSLEAISTTLEIKSKHFTIKSRE